MNEHTTFTPDMDFINGLKKDGGWVDATNEVALAHLQAGYVKSDGEIDNDGDVFYVLTPAGFDLTRPVVTPEAVAKFVPFVKPVREKKPARPPPVVSEIIDTADEEWAKKRRPGYFGRDPNAKRASPVRDALGFDKMEIGQSRHIAATELVPEPWKTYGSTVAVENSRYAEQRRDEKGKAIVHYRKNRKGETKPYPVWDYSRKFIIFKAHDSDPYGPGARLKRIDPVVAE